MKQGKVTDLMLQSAVGSGNCSRFALLKSVIELYNLFNPGTCESIESKSFLLWNITLKIPQHLDYWDLKLIRNLIRYQKLFKNSFSCMDQ